MIRHPTTDVSITYHKSIATIEPITDRAKQWCSDHLWRDWRAWGRRIPVELRLLRAIVRDMVRDKIVVWVEDKEEQP